MSRLQAYRRPSYIVLEGEICGMTINGIPLDEDQARKLRDDLTVALGEPVSPFTVVPGKQCKKCKQWAPE